jgi:queuine tRNA-ribosyltransferase
VKLRRTAYRFAAEPIDPACRCPVCAAHSRAYIHHLIKANEGLGWRLIARHNIYFYHDLMREIRAQILAGTFAAYHREKRAALVRGDTEPEKHVARALRKRPHRLGNFSLRIRDDGGAHIRQESSGETMHPTVAPEIEAHQLYVAQAGLLARAAEAHTEPLVVWDVGLGAAHNAMAGVAALDAAGMRGEVRRPVAIVSFENDLDALRLALTHVTKFPHLQHAGPPTVLRSAGWTSKKAPIAWSLVPGDFAVELDAQPRPQLIWFDPFSANADGPLWTLATFARIMRHCAAEGATLHTYSSSTAVRAKMLAAGWFVIAAPGAGARAESTVAVSTAATAAAACAWSGGHALGKDWLAKWERSSAKGGEGLDESERAAFDEAVRAHPQFREI